MPSSADRPASGAALWRLNVAGLVREALERSSDGVIRREVAAELLTAWFAEHPEERKPPTAPRWNKRGRSREAAEQSVDVDRRGARAAGLDPFHAEIADMTADELLAKARRLECRRRS